MGGMLSAPDDEHPGAKAGAAEGAVAKKRFTVLPAGVAHEGAYIGGAGPMPPDGVCKL